MDRHESNSAGGIIAGNPAITPLRWKLDTKPEMPSHGQIAKNASGAFARNLKSLLKGNSLNADPDEIERRREICDACEFMRDNRCTQCGCWLQYKARLKAENCPIKKW